MIGIRRVHRIEGPVDAVVSVPGSKSIANRVLVCAALAEGPSELTNVPDGDDTMALLSCLRALGLDAELDRGRVAITGTGPSWSGEPRLLHAGLAGTTSRFVTALASLGRGPITVDGHPPLRRRPFGPLHEALVGLGVTVRPGESFGHLPATIEGPPASGTVSMRGDVSSQYVTALMLIGPYLPGGLRLELTTSLVSRPYVDLTAAVMAWFGIDDVGIDARSIRVPPGSYRPTTVAIEPDASSAGYPLAIAALAGGTVAVPGLGLGALQGDARFADLLGRMGCLVERTAGEVRVHRGPGRLQGIDVDMADVSDLVPTMAVVAAFADSPTRIRGVGFIRRKESDRLGDLASELRRAGVDVHEAAEGLDVSPSADIAHGARLGTHHDHRLAMAFAVLGTVVDGIEIEDPDVVTKSWPAFWAMLDESFG